MNLLGHASYPKLFKIWLQSPAEYLALKRRFALIFLRLQVGWQHYMLFAPSFFFWRRSAFLRLLRIIDYRKRSNLKTCLIFLATKVLVSPVTSLSLAIKMAPPVEALKMFLDVGGFESLKIEADPAAYSKAVGGGDRRFSDVCITASP